ncbi:MAG: hypothetical protein HZB67_04705 [Candidatus Aenigmarchaeota archaeon]|nr:hypothetical protein [Candidatus Aenigmarchaeota archaeon]
MPIAKGNNNTGIKTQQWHLYGYSLTILEVIGRDRDHVFAWFLKMAKAHIKLETSWPFAVCYSVRLRRRIQKYCCVPCDLIACQ